MHLPSDYHKAMEQFLVKNELNFGNLGQPLRFSLVGKLSGPGLDVIMSIIGKEQTIKRIEKGLEILNKKDV